MPFHTVHFRRQLMFTAMVVCCSVCWAIDPAAVAAQDDGPVAKRPNVLFLISDDLRPELGCYGVAEIKSPRIDELAGRGVVFNRAYCQQAVCSPSRSSVMTGMRPDQTKVTNLTTHFRKALPDVVTLPQLFKNHGYVSRGLGKIYHRRELDDPASWTTAASAVPQLFNGAIASQQFVSVETLWQDEDETTTIPLTKTNRSKPFRKSDDPANGGGEAKLADEAIAALREFKKNPDPFFLAVGFRKPHLPFVVPKHYWDLYDPEKIPFATNRFLPKDAPSFAMVEKNEMWNYSGVPDTPDLPDDFARQLKHGYYAAVSYMDAQLGRVLDALDELGLAENTIIVLWGDHGWKLGEHNRWCKHSNVEDDARAPLIVSYPGLPSAGAKSEAIVEFVDIYPTVVDLAGLPVADDLAGRSLKPLLEKPDRDWDHVAISQYHRKVGGKKLMGYSIRTDHYRYTRWVAQADHSDLVADELYDHQIDPQENINIAAKSENAELVEKLADRWTAALQSTGSYQAPPEK